jgi:hypothetical protein
MRNNRFGLLGILGLAALTQCAKDPELAPAQAPAAPPVAAAPVAPGTATSVPVASAPPVAATPPAPEPYPMCAGQKLEQASPPARSGAVSVQLAPAFLDQMSSCKAEDALPKDVLARAGAGSVDAKGDCVFASVGVSCHYHSGSEFISSSTKEEPMGQGEVHCIFPSDDPKSPRVFGAHVTCSDPTRGKPAPEHAGHEGHGEHEVKTGAACGADLLNQLATCQSSKCCDDGTLTNAISDLVKDGRNDVRPDFRICEQALTIDCSLLENMHPHTANAPALGGIGKPVFGVGASKAKTGAPEKKAHAEAHPEKK